LADVFSGHGTCRSRHDAVGRGSDAGRSQKRWHEGAGGNGRRLGCEQHDDRRRKGHTPGERRHELLETLHQARAHLRTRLLRTVWTGRRLCRLMAGHFAGARLPGVRSPRHCKRIRAGQWHSRQRPQHGHHANNCKPTMANALSHPSILTQVGRTINITATSAQIPLNFRHAIGLIAALAGHAVEIAAARTRRHRRRP